MSDKKHEVYKYLVEHASESPSVREICAALGIKSTSTVFRILHQLEDEGLIDMAQGKRRNASVAKETSSVMVPLLGTVAAGVPILAQQSIESFVTFDTHREDPGELFALKVKGDSMINAGILNGDIIISRRTSIAEDGEIVVALIGDEATVKRFYRGKGCIELHAENPAYAPIVTTEAIILGKVIANFRYYE